MPKLIARVWQFIRIRFLAFFFSSSLFICSVLLTFDRSPSRWLICQKEDTSVALCIRGWLAPLSGLSSVLVAIIALSFAFRQFQIANDQQRLAILKDRLEKIAQFQAVAVVAYASYFEASESMLRLSEMAVEGVDINKQISLAQSALRVAKSEREKLRPIVRDATMDLDIRDLSQEVFEKCDFNRLHSISCLSRTLNNNDFARFSHDVQLFLKKGAEEARKTGLRMRVILDTVDALGNDIKLDRHQILVRRRSSE